MDGLPSSVSAAELSVDRRYANRQSTNSVQYSTIYLYVP